MRGLTVSIISLLVMALAVAGQAVAKENPPAGSEPVATMDSGLGIAPGAPEEVKQEVKKFLETKGNG